MRRYIFKILLMFFLMTGISQVSVAEPPEDLDRPPSKEQREKVRKRIETLRMWKLTETLDLDEKTSIQLFPLLGKYDRKRAEIEEGMRDYMKQLREALKEKREGNLKSLLEKLEQNHKEIQRLNIEEWSEMKKILTVEQQAKFIVFREEFNREIRRVIAEAGEKRPGKFGKEKPVRPLPPERP